MGAARIGLAVAVILILGLLQPQADDLTVYYGLLHAHSLVSDGSGTPQAAFAAAKNAGLDFFGLSPHNHSAAEAGAKGSRRDGVLIANDHDLYSGTSSVTVTRKWKEGNQPKTESVTVTPVVKAANDKTSANFVALYGQEYSTISAGNHVNIFNYDEVITVGNGDFTNFYALVSSELDGGNTVVVQMNHPNVQSDLFYKGNNEKTKKKMFNDYGIDEYGKDFSMLVPAADRAISLVEILSGPAMKKSRPAHFSYGTHENDYYFYLTQGFHLSPSAGQDNHYETWGDVTDARVGVWAESLTKASLLTAIRSNRTFATEDKNLSVMLKGNGKPMGSDLTLETESPLNLEVTLKDTSESSTDYTVILYYGTVEAQKAASATNWKASDGKQESKSRTGDGTVTFGDYQASGSPEFFYVKVVQDDGDRAWSAPIWINHPMTESGEMFMWSAKSRAKVYHKLGCKTARLISAANRETGSSAPDDWRLHNCVLDEEDEGH